MNIERLSLPSWAGGFHGATGQDIGEERFKKLAMAASTAGIRTFISSDSVGNGAASEALGSVLKTLRREAIHVISMVGRDFYSGRRGHAGIPCFTDSGLRPESDYADYLQMAVEKELARLHVTYLDVLLLNQPDQTGFSSEAVWKGLLRLREQGLCKELGIATGTTPGFILDLLVACDRFSDAIQWVQLPYGPLDAWPARHFLPAALKRNIRIIASPFDHHGLLHGDLTNEQQLARSDSRRQIHGPWLKTGVEKVQAMRKLQGLLVTPPIQIAALWTLGSPGISGIIPSLIQETGDGVRSVEDKLADVIAAAHHTPLSDEHWKAVQQIGNNDGTLPLKGASAQYQGPAQTTQWPITPAHHESAVRWGLVPDRDLYCATDPRDLRERGQPAKGVPTFVDKRLFMQLTVLTGATDTTPLVEALRASSLEAVLYAGVNDPRSVALLTLGEDMEALVAATRRLVASPAYASLSPESRYAMLGRTYSLGHEPDLDHWLLRRPRHNVFNPQWPWAVWYPLRRTGAFYRLPKPEQTAMLMEHGVIGRSFGEAGYASDIRLECFGLDADDNEFVIGLTSSRLDWISKLVQAMRPTVQTSTYMSKMGPFFVGRVLHRNTAGQTRG